MAEVTTKTYIETSGVINQCDIFKDVEYIEYAIVLQPTSFDRKPIELPVH